MQGARLDRVGSNGKWLHVRRSGWIWEPSVERLSGPQQSVDGSVAGAARRDTAARTGRRDTASRSPRPDTIRPPAPSDSSAAAHAASAADGTSAADSTAAAAAAGTAAGSFAGFSGAVLVEAPRGDTVAVVRPLAELRLLERNGEWARVRLEGWVRSQEVTAAPDSGRVLEDGNVAALGVQGEALRGRAVRWSLAFLSLQQAESLRSDFDAGEYFILARGPGDLDRLVYVAVPDRLLPRVRELAPLQRFTALGRIRAARSSQTGAPVIELLGLR